MNKRSIPILLLCAGLFASCKDKEDVRSETQCVQARFIYHYCPATEPLYLVEIMTPTRLATRYAQNDATKPRYYAAMLDLPESVRVRDTIFYMQIHRDPVRESKVTLGYCTADRLPSNILVCEGISQQACL